MVICIFLATDSYTDKSLSALPESRVDGVDRTTAYPLRLPLPNRAWEAVADTRGSRYCKPLKTAPHFQYFTILSLPSYTASDL